MNATVNMADAMRRVTISVKITGARSAKIRMAIGVRMIKLGARVIGCGIEVSTK